MKIPKDINSESLIKLLKIYGYSITRQTGSHIRLTSISFIELNQPFHLQTFCGKRTVIYCTEKKYI